MPALQGRLEVVRLQQRLNAVFARVDSVDPNALELQADMARYLCVLVTGYVERTLQELTTAWCRGQSSPSVARYAARMLARIQNVNAERLKQTLEHFDPVWRNEVEQNFSEELEALDSLCGNRNQIAHGSDVGITVVQTRAYYDSVQRLINHLIQRMDP